MTILQLAPVRDGIDAPRVFGRPPRETPWQWLSRRLEPTPDSLILAVIALLAAGVRLVNLFNFPGLADDEGTYSSQAQAVRWGELAHYTYWYDHPPLGWIQLGALDWIPQHLFPHAQPVAASRVIVVLFATVTTVLCYPFARRMGAGRVTAIAGCLVAAFSPLAVTLQRQVYLDTISTAWVVGAFVLALDKRQRMWVHVGAGICFGIGVLTKETNAVLLPALLWAVFQSSNRRTRLFSSVGVVGSFALVVAYYPLMAVLRGELLQGPGHVSLEQGVLFQLSSRAGSGAMWHAGSDSSTILHGWLFFDSWIMVAGVVTIPIALIVRRLRPVAVGNLILVLVGLRPGGYLPAMYVLTMIPFLAVTATTSLEAIWRLTGRPRWLAVQLVLRAGFGFAVAFALTIMIPQWTASLQGAFSQHTNNDRLAAERWMASNVKPGSVILTDDVTWLRLVQQHVSARHDVIWFYKLDTDPGVEKKFPDGWRDVDYVFSTDQLRLAVAGNPALTNSSHALRDSTVVASFGGGGSVVQIRRVDPDAPDKGVEAAQLPNGSKS